MNTRKIISSIVLISTLTGCGPSPTNSTQAHKYTKQTPLALRSIPNADLSAEVSIGDITKTYQGSDFPDGRWLIDIDLQPNLTYPITISWFALTHLVLEEKGQFYTDTTTLTISPELESISAGYDRFDDDCDGMSNIEEIRNETDPSTAPGLDQTACAVVAEVVVLRDQEFPWITRQHKIFQSLALPSRVTKYEQSVQVRSTQPDLDSRYGISLLTVEPEENRTTANLDFINDQERGKRLRFRITHADSAIRSTVMDSSCIRYGEDDKGYSCAIPYEWQEQQWYSLRFEALSETIWQGVVRHRASGDSLVVAEITTQPNIDWYRPQTGLGYIENVPAEQCRLGLAPIGMRFTKGVVNNNHILDSLQVLPGPCVNAGAGWSEGIRTEGDELVYTLNLGRLE